MRVEGTEGREGLGPVEGQAGPAKPQRRPGACGQPATFPAAPLPSPSPEALAEDELTADPTKAPTDHSSGQLGPGTQIRSQVTPCQDACLHTPRKGLLMATG